MPGTPAEEKKVVSGSAAKARAAWVVAPARLHLGFLDLNGGLGRKYGGIGLAVDRPATEVVVRRSNGLAANGVEKHRAFATARRLAEALDLPCNFAVDVRRAIPEHAGLGSGTQLALAVGAGLAALAGRRLSSNALAGLTDRGARSGIGMAAFEQGGFIVDGGRGSRDAPPPVLVRLSFPEDWRVLLVLDKAAEGVHGEKETRAFATLASFSEASAGHLCRLVLMQLLPGLVERDIGAFGAALTEIQTMVGAHFAAAQGGSPWSSPAVGRLVAKLGDAGAVGLGQSSWGPTGFAFTESEDAARRLYESAAEAARAENLEVLIARGRNAGASVELHETADLGA